MSEPGKSPLELLQHSSVVLGLVFVCFYVLGLAFFVWCDIVTPGIAHPTGDASLPLGF